MMNIGRKRLYIFYQKDLNSPSSCPKCGSVANLYKHGKKNQLFFDLPMHAKRVGIYVQRQRINVGNVMEPSLKIYQIWTTIAQLLIV